jgi:TRAP-type C4-dicarboxylate transport system permease small subunit
MGDYLLIGGIILGFLLVGTSCIIRPRGMSWLTRGLLTSFLPEPVRIMWTRIVGVIVLLFSLILVYGLLTSLF